MGQSEANKLCCSRAEILEAAIIIGGRGEDDTESVCAPVSVQHYIKVWSLLISREYGGGGGGA